MLHLLTTLGAAFGGASHETAIFMIAAIVCWALAAFASAVAGRFPGGALGLIALGLLLFFFPQVYNTAVAAF